MVTSPVTEKGKNFSANNLGQRKKSDFYETPYSITEQLLEREIFTGTILEPACGAGAISRIVNATASYDIEKNFFTETAEYDNIVTNPPFSLAYEFVQKAKAVAKKKIAMLLPLSYLHGKKRYDHIYQDTKFPLARVYVFTRYPMLGDDLREDGKYRTGMMVYAWFVWDKDYSGKPTIDWIDNNDNVISKKDMVDISCEWCRGSGYSATPLLCPFCLGTGKQTYESKEQPNE